MSTSQPVFDGCAREAGEDVDVAGITGWPRSMAFAARFPSVGRAGCDASQGTLTKWHPS
ncbi:hypothetical protein JN086_08345 [Mycolicibacterium austroafricanum]|uniref:hypothetical protein n=1 Tax=Mycolicibacterium austroafricanum TaxID=39687 RepID=UPI001ABF7282|nr:hypothetical protein [Mycolicibacterium austroafricanum]QRZ08343.1 hypothetical protein JN090_07400 [Mycolicibacterium austroafricanum]QZT69996.1 hypothetical protein JN086_08345 [Mycolicibacterium austroafricanum]